MNASLAGYAATDQFTELASLQWHEFADAHRLRLNVILSNSTSELSHVASNQS
jgi:outer membrane biogenesis lipoprotein LolB